MGYLIERFGYMEGYLFMAFFVFLRYVLFAGIPFLIFYSLRKTRLEASKIQVKEAKSKQIKREIGHSLMTSFIFASLGVGIYWMFQNGWTQIYTDISSYGIAYFVVSVFAIMFIHDSYFYWMHRTVHHPKLFPIFHKTHHLSTNPTPWTSFSFDAAEAVLEMAIIPVIILVLPVHFGAILFFFFISLAFNVLGHLGYEVMPKYWVKHPILKWLNTSTHHNMHHKRANGNYGLYFNFWDTWMGTNHKSYVKTFEKIVDKREAAKMERFLVKEVK